MASGKNRREPTLRQFDAPARGQTDDRDRGKQVRQQHAQIAALSPRYLTERYGDANEPKQSMAPAWIAPGKIFPDPTFEFPVVVNFFLCFCSQGNFRIISRFRWVRAHRTAIIRSKSQKFPVFSLLIRELDPETGSLPTARTATQSGVSALWRVSPRQ